MVSAATQTSGKKKSSVKSSQKKLTLHDLATMSPDELAQLYQEGTVPTSMAPLNGSPVGRMLTFVGFAGKPAIAKWIGRYSASDKFFWDGKNFASENGGDGTGNNRVWLFGRRELFPFTTRFEPSAIDGKSCILLDYDQPKNPFFIRRVRDELREVSDKLFLGPAMAEIGGQPRLVLWFAVDNTGS